MDEPTGKQRKAESPGESEVAETIKKQEELLDRWCEQLPRDESIAWMEAHIQDKETDLAKLEQEKADFEAIARVMGGHKSVGDAIRQILKKEAKTLTEAEAIDAFVRVADKLRRME